MGGRSSLENTHQRAKEGKHHQRAEHDADNAGPKLFPFLLLFGLNSHGSNPSFPARLLRLMFIGLDSLRKLIGARGIPAANHAPENFFYFVCLSPDYHPGQALGVSPAAVMKLAMGNHAVFNLQIDLGGTGAFGFVLKHVFILLQMVAAQSRGSFRKMAYSATSTYRPLLRSRWRNVPS